MNCASKHARIYAIEEVIASTIHPFNDAMAPSTNVKTVNMQYAHDTPCGRTFILQVSHCLDFTKSMEHSILCTNQAIAHGTIVNDYQKFFDRSLLQSMFLKLEDKDIAHKNHSELPINFYSPVPYIDVHYPTDNEIETCPIIHLTDEEGWYMDLIPQISIVKLREDMIDEHPLDHHLVQSNLLHETQNTILIFATTHSSYNLKC